MSRRDVLKAALTRRDQQLPDGNFVVEESEADAAGAPEKKLQHIRSGAVGAMGRSLGHIASAADQARALIAAGSAVLELDPDLIETSFVADRLPDEGEDYRRLSEAIAESGQKSPILVRPHPTKPEHFQTVFGHRRVRVLRSLGRKVRAVVQNLTDEELVVVQGQENSARSDLSYIERALFALALEAKGFDRHVIMSSLSMEKTQLSRLMSVGHSLPRHLVEAIGPAPKAGRPRWVALAEQLPNADVKSLDALVARESFRHLDSDARFLQVVSFLATKRVGVKPEAIKANDGTKLASVERKGEKVSLAFDEKTAPKFADFVVSQLRDLHQQYLDSLQG